MIFLSFAVKKFSLFYHIFRLPPIPNLAFVCQISHFFDIFRIMVNFTIDFSREIWLSNMVILNLSQIVR